jgi:hypothetical protein
MLTQLHMRLEKSVGFILKITIFGTLSILYLRLFLSLYKQHYLTFYRLLLDIDAHCTL